MRFHFRLLILSLVMVTLVGCLISREEVARESSPSGKVDAVLIESDGGATTSVAYDIYVVPTGSSTWRRQEVAFLYGAVRNESAYGVNLRWASDSSLILEYLTAHQVDLIKSSVSVAGEEINVTLQEGVSDPDAPPGSMLYNLMGRPHDKR